MSTFLLNMKILGFLKFIFLIASLQLPLLNIAATVTVDKDNIRYTVDTEAQTAEVYGPVSSSTNITDLVIPDYIQYNGKSIPVSSIRNYAFQDNKNLKGSLTIGVNVQTIGNNAFYLCSGFTGSLTIGDNVQTIGKSAFSRCSGFTGPLTIGDNVQTIGESAFNQCSGFTGSLTIGDNVQSIGDYAFWDCSGFTGSLTIGDNVQTIGIAAFSGCSGFTGSLTIPNSVQTIGNSAFQHCSGFTGSLTIGDKVQTIEDYAFWDCSGFTGSLTIPNSVQTIGIAAFSGCSGFTGSLTIPNSVQTIGNSAFSRCSGFTGSLSIPNSVQTIGNNAFYLCSGFTGSLTIGDNVQTIEDFAFQYCSGFTGSLTIPNSVQTIGNSAFSRCSGFTGSLTIGDNVQTIEDFAFRDCSGFTKIECDAFIPPTIGPTYNCFDSSTLSSVCLFVPQNLVVKYQAAQYWRDFKCINPIPVEATDIKLNKTELTLLVDQKETLIATITPEDATSEIVWSVDESGKDVVSVDQSGKVTALSVGKATITASAGSVSASCEIEVSAILATSITINGDDVTTLKETETLQLTAIVLPENTTYPGVTWESSSAEMATVSDNGLVTALSTGEVEISAWVTNQPQIKSTYKITVEKRILGDANDNGVVNVADVGTISDYIVKKPFSKFCFVNADVVTDGQITTADVTATVNIIFNDTPAMMKFGQARRVSANGNLLIIDDFNSTTPLVSLDLENPTLFTGLQGSIVIPDGMVIEKVRKGSGAVNHILNHNITEEGTVEFILYSLQNAPFVDSNGSLLELEITAERNSGDFIVNNILASDDSANEYTLSFTGGKNNELITSLDRLDNSDIRIYSDSDGIVILNAQGESVNIFNMAGERIISAEARSNKEFYPLSKGIYIVTVKSETAKLIVK